MEKTVFFRAFEEKDAELIYQWMNDDGLKQLSTGLNRRMCKEEALDWVKARMRHNPYQVFWAICAIDSDEMIGYTCLTDIHYINSSACFGGLIIGNKAYQDGMAWIESYLFVYGYAFERLGLNRVYGESLMEHETTHIMGEVMFSTREGIMRQASYKNGKFYDVSFGSLLRHEYFDHKLKGDYELSAVLKRLTKVIKEKKKKV